MRFTYESYIGLIELIQRKGYVITSYGNYKDYDKCVILRHDVDYSLQSAYQLAHVERGIGKGVRSIYFLLLTTDFYNVLSLNSLKKIEGILECGHEIGLHFDETRYPGEMINTSSIIDRILEEADILSKAVGVTITNVSMHRPSKNMLSADLKIHGMINSYGQTFFRQFKYLSDSHRYWREPVKDIICKERFEKLHILTHPFWYFDEEKNLYDTIKEFIKSANKSRYDMLEENFSNLDVVLKREEIQ